jgi:hypothetical protein
LITGVLSFATTVLMSLRSSRAPSGKGPGCVSATSSGRGFKAFSASAKASIREPGFGFFDLAIYWSSGKIAVSAFGKGFGASARRRRSRAALQRGTRRLPGRP